MRSSHYELISFWTISQTVLSDIFACIVCTHVCRHSLSKHMNRNSTDGSMSFTKYYWSCWFIIWRSPVTPDGSPLHHCHLKVCPPDEKQVDSNILLGTNISPQKGTFEDDFPFPQVGLVSSLEGTYKWFTVIWRATKLNLYHSSYSHLWSVQGYSWFNLPVH